jgi:O-antigen/teichoic acid export membrane protein
MNLATVYRREGAKIKNSLFARNAGWMFLGQGLAVVSQGVYFILLARLLGVLEYGIFGGAFAMVMIVANYCALGSHSVFLRYVSADHSRYALYWGNILLTTLSVGSLVSLLVIGVGPLLAHSYSQSMLAWIAIANCLCAQLTLAAGRVFQTFEQMRTTALLNLLTNLLRTLAAIVLLIGWHRATAGQWAFAAMLVSLVATVVAVWVVRRRYGPAEFSLRLARDRAGEGLVFALCYSTSGFYNDLDKAMLGHYGMNVANGIYTMAYRAVDVCTMPLYAIQAAAFPRFFKKGEATGLGSTASYALKILKRTAPYGALAAAAMFLSAPLIPWVLGSGFRESTEALRWLCLLPLFRSFHISAGDAIAGGGHVPVRLATQSVAAVFNFAVNLYLIPRYSWHGAAWSSLATDGLLAILNWAVLLAMAERARKEKEIYD